MAQCTQAQTGPTVAELAEDFELSLVAANKSPATIRVYTTAEGASPAGDSTNLAAILKARAS